MASSAIVSTAGHERLPMNATHATHVTCQQRDVTLTCALGEDVLQFHSMQGEEALGRMFDYRVKLIGAHDDPDLRGLPGSSMTVKLAHRHGMRYFNGLVTRFTQAGRTGAFSLYEATLRPALWLLTRCTDCRIFENMSVQEILESILSQPQYAGRVVLQNPVRSELYRRILPRSVQYRETDCNFVCRLLEQAGLYFYFLHEADRHRMVLAETVSDHDVLHGYARVDFAAEGVANLASEEVITSWRRSGELQASTMVYNDFDVLQPRASHGGSLLARASVAAPAEFSATGAGFAMAGQLEQYDYPGLYRDAADGSAMARAQLERLRGDCDVVDGSSNARGLAAGALFELGGHASVGQNGRYLLTSASYTISANDHIAGEGGAGSEFDCVFTAAPARHAYRPARHAVAPLIGGPQTAIVLGDTQRAWTQDHGCIKVRFHWERGNGSGQERQPVETWVRVAQCWAGQGWGAQFMPRPGMEVVVEFLEGNPDRPLVTGCVYNADFQPPYALPAQQKHAGFKTSSDQGYNELRFEDEEGRERLVLHAARDMLREVLHDDALAVSNNQRVNIEGKQATTVGKSMVIEAGLSIELRVGGSRIRLEPGSIVIESATVAIQSSATTQIEAGGPMTIAGAIVKIN